MSDETRVDAREQSRAYQIVQQEEMATAIVTRLMVDINLRKWCVEQAIAGKVTPESVHAFITAGLKTAAIPDEAA